MSENFLLETLYYLPGIIIGLSFHEFMHALVADKLGDPTPRSQGRITMSPLRHLDPLGLILIIILKFGWAKPVEINTRYFKNPRRDHMLVSAAGPFGNLFLAIMFLTVFKLLDLSVLQNGVSEATYLVIKNLFILSTYINVMLFVFNLLPIPPLDGFQVFSGFVPARYYQQISFLHKYGSLILILIIITPVAGYIISPPIRFIFLSLSAILGIN